MYYGVRTIVSAALLTVDSCDPLPSMGDAGLPATVFAPALPSRCCFTQVSDIFDRRRPGGATAWPGRTEPASLRVKLTSAMLLAFYD